MSSGPPPPTAPAVNPAVAAPVSALVAPGGAVPVSVSAPVQNSHNPHNSVTAGATGLSSGVVGVHRQGFLMAKFHSLDCARVEGVGAPSKESKGSNFAA